MAMISSSLLNLVVSPTTTYWDNRILRPSNSFRLQTSRYRLPKGQHGELPVMNVPQPLPQRLIALRSRIRLRGRLQLLRACSLETLADFFVWSG